MLLIVWWRQVQFTSKHIKEKLGLYLLNSNCIVLKWSPCWTLWSEGWQVTVEANVWMNQWIMQHLIYSSDHKFTHPQQNGKQKMFVFLKKKVNHTFLLFSNGAQMKLFIITNYSNPNNNWNYTGDPCQKFTYPWACLCRSKFTVKVQNPTCLTNLSLCLCLCVYK